MKQIIAMGGGGFSMEPDNPLLDTYVLQQAKSQQPKICFVGTASGDADGYIQRFYKAFNRYDCIPSHLSLFEAPMDLEDYVLDKDIIYVGGGSTRNLLVLWKEWKLDLYLKRVWENGTVLAGLSAGSLCWFEEGVTDSNPGELTKLNGLGWLPGSNCPHYDGETNFRPAYHRLIQSGQLRGGAVYVVFSNGRHRGYLTEIVYFRNVTVVGELILAKMVKIIVPAANKLTDVRYIVKYIDIS